MFDRLSKLYKDGRITEVGLQNAVDIGWITREEYNIIIASDMSE